MTKVGGADFQAAAKPMSASFNSGELSPLLWNRVKFERYAPGAMLLQNFIVTKHGPFFRRPGSLYVDFAKRSTLDFNLDKKRFKRFTFNRTQVFMLEFGHKYIRFFTYDIDGNPIKVMKDGAEYVVETPYRAEDLTELRFTQSMDTVFITHSLYKSRTLVRKASSNWTFGEFVTVDGPYENENLDTTKTMSVAAVAVGSTTLTANFDIFTQEMIGRYVRLTLNKKPGWGKITAVTSLRVATFEIKSAIAATTATSSFFLGAWYGTEGNAATAHYPAAVSFHMERLYFGGGLYTPQTIQGSRPGDFPAFPPTDADDLVTDDMAVSFTLATDELNAIAWIKSTDSLYIGTIGPEFKLTTDASTVITPAVFQFSRITNYGSSPIEPQFVGNSIIFSQNSLRTLRELTYQYTEDKFVANDISLLGEHLTSVGLSSFNYQQEPHNIIWSTQCVREQNNEGIVERTGGLLLGLTYDKEQNVIAWHRHTIGGEEVEIEYVESAFNYALQQDQVWYVARRKLNGQYVRTIEVLDKDFRMDVPQRDIYFVDCGVKYNAYKLPIADPNYGKAVSSLTGLTWLANTTVQVTVDGATHPEKVVSATGELDLDYAGKYIAVGLGSVARYQSLYLDPEVGDKSFAQGYTQNIPECTVRFFRTMGGSMGPTFDKLQPIEYRTPGDLMDTALPLFSGEKKIQFESTYQTSAQICIEQTEPQPMTILAVIPKVRVVKN